MKGPEASPLGFSIKTRGPLNYIDTVWAQAQNFKIEKTCGHELLTAGLGSVEKNACYKRGRKRKRTPQREVRELGAAACRWEALTKKMPAINASGKVKEKAEPRTRIASRLSLGSVDKKDARYKRGHKTSE